MDQRILAVGYFQFKLIVAETKFISLIPNSNLCSKPGWFAVVNSRRLLVPTSRYLNHCKNASRYYYFCWSRTLHRKLLLFHSRLDHSHDGWYYHACIPCYAYTKHTFKRNSTKAMWWCSASSEWQQLTSSHVLPHHPAAVTAQNNICLHSSHRQPQATSDGLERKRYQEKCA